MQQSQERRDQLSVPVAPDLRAAIELTGMIPLAS
jgi:hypothetical protein